MMFEIEQVRADLIRLHGKLDATQADALRQALARLEASCTLDFGGLDYISSAGLGVLVATQKRLEGAGAVLTITGPQPHIRELLTLARFDLVFPID